MSAQASMLAPSDAKQAAGAWARQERNPSPAWATPRAAWRHWLAFKWMPVRSPKHRCTSPSKVLKGSGLCAGRIASHAVHHTTEPCAGAKKTQTHLQVFQLSHRFKKFTGLGRPLGSVLTDVSVVSNGRPQELKVVDENSAASIRSLQQSSGEVRLQERSAGVAQHHQLALAKVEFEADVSSTSLG